MKRFFNKALLLLGFSLFVGAPIMAVATPITPPVSAACGDEGVLGIPAWYRGLTDASRDCMISTPAAGDDKTLSTFIWKIVLNITNMIMVIIGYIAVFFIIYGGFLYMTGGSNPSQLEKAKKSITNAIIGLAIAILATVIVNVIFGII